MYKFTNHETIRMLMRISLLQLLLTVWLVNGVLAANAQELLDQRVSIRLDNNTFRQALQTLEKTAHIKFVYSRQIVQIDRKVSLAATDEKLADILERLLKPLQLRYVVTGSQIAIVPGPSADDVGDTGPSQAHLEAADRTITGTVKSETGQGLPGVSVVVKNTTRGTTTDVDGRYRLSIPDNESGTVLVFSFVGYLNQEMAIGSRSTIDVQLAPDTKALGEVVVVGYGTRTKSSITGSIASVKAEELKVTPVANLAQGIQGRVPGLDMRQNSGTPGGNISVRIRGTNSINGTSEPLYVIDGIQISATSAVNAANPLSQINPSDIESVEVLKDAAATAIYGARAANGVVLITTKRGKDGVTNVTYDGYVGQQETTRKLGILDASQFAQLENDTYNPTVIYPNPASVGKGTNYLDLIFRKAMIQNHQLSVTSGNNKTQIALGANYFNQDGIIKSTNYKRYAFRANIDHRINDRFKLGTSLYYTVTNENRVNAGGTGVNVTSAREGILGRAVAAPPVLLPFRPDGSVYSFADQMNGRYRETVNPMGELAKKDYTTNNRLLGNLYLEVAIVKGLTYRASFNADLTSGLQEQYSPRSIVDSISLNNPNAVNGSASNNSNYFRSLLHESILTYKNVFRQHHSLNITAVYATQSDILQTNNQTASGFGNDFTQNYATGNATVYALSSSRSKSSLVSYLGRVSYGFKDRYFLDLTGRIDGSSKFGANNKYGFFPAISGAWRVIEEDFMKPVTFITDLKVRASYGVTGNAGAIGSYQSLATVSGQGYNYNFNNNVQTGINPTAIANPDLKWEQATQLDIGVDLALLNNRLNVVADYYHKRTDNLLFTKALPWSSGYTTITGNYGSIENKGFELGISGKILTGIVKWDASGNITFNQNKVLALDGIQQELALSSYSILKVGYPLGVYRTYILDGINQTGETFLPGYDARTGGFKIKDVNGDGKISTDDQVIVGNAQPKYFFGFSSSVKYKNFELSGFVQGVQGSRLFNGFRFTFETPSGQVNLLEGMANRWSATNPNNEYVKPAQGTNLPVGDRWVEDNSYIRVKNLTLAYNLPRTKFSKSIRAYVSGNNLFTITNYQGWDPESNNYGSSNALFYDNGTYPAAKSYVVGLQCTF
ncbi:MULTISPECIES: TonB-dependent receptor [unclassified Spirosoma]|uniref:TonB-dependent receptor n=1 Tax=unclassified Spirosoma TaxID=2621999 RepID=UPI0009607E42|nr:MULTISPECIES: TonB-dependent receptor [unclassified Spirosoma]MBN8823270.1 TonB-dependent receptor [Spirosoma sp.]OJW72583.1 MAG: SusC/RagA family TonB-linked outer membrane protein [Spirosoma sp. 48-14]